MHIHTHLSQKIINCEIFPPAAKTTDAFWIMDTKIQSNFFSSSKACHGVEKKLYVFITWWSMAIGAAAAAMVEMH